MPMGCRGILETGTPAPSRRLFMCTRRSDSRERLLEQRQVNRHEHHARAGAGANTCCCTTSPAVAWAAAAARLACSPLCPPSAAAEARIKRRFHHTSHITHHTSHITHHTSHVTRHTSHVTRYTTPARTSCQTASPPAAALQSSPPPPPAARPAALPWAAPCR